MPESPIPEPFPSLAKRAVVLTGPTASGKSSLAMRLAQRMDIEILSLDSIAVYRQMDIGTAKPSLEDRKSVPHHLIDLEDPDRDFSVAPYLKLAHRIVREVLSRGRVPVFVGGTPMFLKAILRGFDPGPPPDWEFRRSVEEDVAAHGVEALRQRLRQVDVLSYHRIAPGDVRRMVRALEVAKATGYPLSHRQVQFDQVPAKEECCVFAMRWPRSELHQRINSRVKQMFETGLVEEVKGLLDHYGQLSRTASMAVGYREVIEGIQHDTPINEQLSLVATHTRQLAKRQETWFRSFSEIRPIDAEKSAGEEAEIEAIERRIRSVFSLA